MFIFSSSALLSHTLPHIFPHEFTTYTYPAVRSGLPV